MREFIILPVLAAAFLAACSSSTSSSSAATSSSSLAAWERESAAAQQRCFAEADSNSQTAKTLTTDQIYGRTTVPPGWDTTYWLCMEREDGILAVKYGIPQDDLDDFSYSYHIATARRADAGVITRDQAKAEHRRISDAVLAERRRRAAEEQAVGDANRRAASLSAVAAGLGAIVQAEPPPPDTTTYVLGGRHVTCSRWQNVVNCY